MKKIILSASILMLLSCRSISMQELSPKEEPINNRLPYLEPMVDKASLAALDNRISFSAKNKDFYYRPNTSRRAVDVTTFFREEVKQNISAEIGDKKGTITLRIMDASTEHCTMCKVAFIGTLGIAPFLGVPADHITQEVKVEVEIRDNKKNVLGRYVTTTSNAEYAAMYYGYRVSDAKEKNTITNLKKAMSDIKMQISDDAEELQKKFK